MDIWKEKSAFFNELQLKTLSDFYHLTNYCTHRQTLSQWEFTYKNNLVSSYHKVIGQHSIECHPK